MLRVWLLLVWLRALLCPIVLQSYLFVDGGSGSIDTAASYANWRVAMIVLCVLTALGIVLEYYFTRERITEENMKLNIKEENCLWLSKPRCA